MKKTTSGVVFYFVGPVGEESQKFKNTAKTLSKYVFKSTNKDEIDQGSRQSGKGVLIFSDAKFALEFMPDISFPGVSMLYCLLIDKNGNYSPEVMKKFRLLGLNFYTPKTVPIMLSEINKFISGEQKQIKEDELDFLSSVDNEDK